MSLVAFLCLWFCRKASACGYQFLDSLKIRGLTGLTSCHICAILFAMTVLEAIIISLIQGTTEFLPVSSSGHIAIANHLMTRLKQADISSFSVALHLATLVAVVVVFRHSIIRVITKERIVLLYLAIGSVPAAFAGYFFKGFFEAINKDIVCVGMALIGSGLFLVLAHIKHKEKKTLKGLTIFDSIMIGIAQSLAIIPGLSRSGSTIGTGIFCGMKRKDSARFSFLLSVPVIIGAGAFKAKDITALEIDKSILIISFLVALLSGIIALRLLLRVIQSRKLIYFAFYCFVLATVVILIRF